MFNKEIFEQEYNDYAEGIIDAKDFYKHFYWFLKMFQVLDGPIPKYTYIIKAIMTILVFIADGLLCLSFSHGLDEFDLPIMTETGNYVLILTYELLIQYYTKLYLVDYHAMQHAIQNDFLFICTKGQKYRKRYFLHQLETRKIFKWATIFTMSVPINMNIFSVGLLLHHLMTHAPGERKRPLLFPYWCYETDFSKSPLYEIAFTFAGTCTIAYAFIYTFMTGTQIVWVRQISCKVDVIIWKIEDLMDGIRPTKNKLKRKDFDVKIQGRMKNIVQHHQQMITLTEQFCRVYKQLLVFGQTISAPVVCLSAYSAAETWEEKGEFNAILVILVFAAVILLFIPCYLCTILSIKVNSIAYACWSIPFWDAGPVIRPYLLLIMQRSLKPLPLKVAGFEEFSVITFSKKMSSAYSYFNMLRQANKK